MDLLTCFQLYFVPLLLLFHGTSSQLSHPNSVNISAIDRGWKDQEVEYGIRTSTGIYSYKDLGSFTKKVTSNNIILPNGADIDTWEPPYNFTRKYVIYYAGNDFDDKPFAVLELGKWHPKKDIEEGHLDVLLCYIYQLIHQIIQIIKRNANEYNRSSSGAVIMDLQSARFEEVTYLPTTIVIMNAMKEYRWQLAKYLDEAIVINMPYMAESVLNLLKPILGSVFEKVTVFGVNPKKYIPQLLRRFPKTSLPPWYGGAKDFKPLQIFG